MTDDRPVFRALHVRPVREHAESWRGASVVLDRRDQLLAVMEPEEALVLAGDLCDAARLAIFDHSESPVETIPGAKDPA